MPALLQKPHRGIQPRRQLQHGGQIVPPLLLHLASGQQAGTAIYHRDGSALRILRKAEHSISKPAVRLVQSVKQREPTAVQKGVLVIPAVLIPAGSKLRVVRGQAGCLYGALHPIGSHLKVELELLSQSLLGLTAQAKGQIAAHQADRQRHGQQPAQ